MTGPDARAILLDAAARGDTPPTIALMRLLMEATDEGVARAALATALDARVRGGDADGAARLRTIGRLWRQTPDAWFIVREIVDGIAHDHAADPDATLDYWAAAFDRLVKVSPEGSVALYSLGSAALLAEATAEIVAALRTWALVRPDTDVLDIGCGIGRFVVALAPKVRSVVGLDLAPGMVAEAGRRCGHLANVRLAVTNGRDLGGVADGSIDLALAADVMPYLVQAGPDIVEDLLSEVARVLRPGGHLLILNHSYRGDLALDRRDLATWARRQGFKITRDGTREFRSWDGATFLLQAPRSFPELPP